MSDVFRVVARLGNSARAAFAGFVLGEFGWDVDTKTLRVGDDTQSPPKIASDKSIGEITYSAQFKPVFANVGLLDGGKVDGVSPRLMNLGQGLVVRGLEDNQWDNRPLEGDDYIEIEIPETNVPGTIKIKATTYLKQRLTSSSNIRYFYGINPPNIDDVRPGDIWFSKGDEVVYMRLGDPEEEAGKHIWLDFTSFSGGGGGVKFFSGENPPSTSSLGDEWYDREENRLYKKLSSNEQLVWVEQV